MKLSINKLIANDIINYGMDQTSEFNYSVSLNGYLNDFDEESQKYILDNLDDIIDCIKDNENVADLFVSEQSDGDKDFDMVFYWGNLLTQVERIVCDNAKALKVDLEFEDIREIADDILRSDTFNADLEYKIKNYDNGRDMG